MKLKRRGFFAALFGAPLAAASVQAVLPIPIGKMVMSSGPVEVTIVGMRAVSATELETMLRDLAQAYKEVHVAI